MTSWFTDTPVFDSTSLVKTNLDSQFSWENRQQLGHPPPQRELCSPWYGGHPKRDSGPNAKLINICKTNSHNVHLSPLPIDFYTWSAKMEVCCCLTYDEIRWLDFQNHLLNTDVLRGKLCEQVNNNNRKQSGVLPEECCLRGGELEGGALEEGQEEARREVGWGEE